MDIDKKIPLAKAGTQNVYTRQARGWDCNRNKGLFEKPWLDRFSARIQPGGHILDLGCGTGDPISKYLLDKGFQVTGVDYSDPMIKMAQERYPRANWIVKDMRAMNFTQNFDGLISWDGFFHLSVEEQRALITSFAGLVKHKGALLLTVGPKEGEVLGAVEGEDVYHASLSPSEYEQRLQENGFHEIEFVAEDVNCGLHSVLLASRI